MKLAAALLALAACASTPAPATCPPPTPASGYDAALAQQLGADEYGMRKYVIAFLKSGTVELPEAETAALMKAHLANIQRMGKEGTLVVAGPFMDDQDVRGIYIFATDSVEEAAALTATDPAVQAKALVMELRPWYGSAAMMQVFTTHERIAKQNP